MENFTLTVCQRLNNYLMDHHSLIKITILEEMVIDGKVQLQLVKAEFKGFNRYYTPIHASTRQHDTFQEANIEYQRSFKLFSKYYQENKISNNLKRLEQYLHA